MNFPLLNKLCIFVNSLLDLLSHGGTEQTHHIKIFSDTIFNLLANMLHIIYAFRLRAEHCKQAKFHKFFGFVHPITD